MTTKTTAYVQPTTRLAVDELAPEIAKAMNGLERAAGRTSLEKPLRELVKLRVAQINGCVYCVDMHSRDAIAGGDTWRRVNLVAVWREAPFFTPRERAAFALAEAMTRLADSEVSQDIWQAAAEEFADQELAELVWHIAIINTWTRLGATTRPWTLSGDENA
ncbi:carboxymuconolactone decarboxylase family protein [Nocardia yamanashiensis]|uniref:carboxymuconolactone decarboxylase family protein n=1 Tax=Nocardia yamanashiensis TaxID=209247 RepID=UPI0009FE62CA|nr:carboxymuconolactone decarboxylase family protein [Nocardia yamanashiensis]UGT43370.1 carboxymuconolactone decarboxylase family protein [Nocardia yamanashiensis]